MSKTLKKLDPTLNKMQLGIVFYFFSYKKEKKCLW